MRPNDHHIIAYQGGPGEVVIDMTGLPDNSELRIRHEAERTFEEMCEDGRLWPWVFTYQKTSARAVHYSAHIDVEGRR